jgi:hypothetical protein
VLLLLVLMASVTASCGVPTDRSARRIDPDEVPFGLLSASPTPEPSAPRGSERRQVFFVRDTGLVGVSRGLAAPTVTALIGALLGGPTDDESSRGLRTAIPAGTVLHGTQRAGDLVTLDLSDQLLQVRGAEQTLAIAQIVFTATAAPGVRSVQLRLNGQSLQVPRGDGTLSDTVGRSDYPGLLG